MASNLLTSSDARYAEQGPYWLISHAEAGATIHAGIFSYGSSAAADFEDFAAEEGRDHLELPALVVLGAGHLAQVLDVEGVHFDGKGIGRLIHGRVKLVDGRIWVSQLP